ncbi:MAG: ABC transporter permease subunit, partial [Pirellulales bacterium]
LFWAAILGCRAASTAGAAAVGLAGAGRRRGLRALPALVLAALSLAVPGPLVGLGLIWVLNSPDLDWTAWLYDSIAAPWAALTVRAFPPALLIVWQALASVPDDQVDSAALEGAGPTLIVRRVVLPQRLAALGVAWLIALAVALGELGASILVVPPGVVTLSIEVFNLLHGGYEDEVAGICLAVFAGCQLMACIAVWLAVRAAARRAEWFSG